MDRLNIDAQLAQEPMSCTVQNLLASISTKLENTPPALLIGNVITSVLRNRPTDIQIALGVLLRDYKTILGYTYDHGITCSYDEILRFKKSAAMDAAKEPEHDNATELRTRQMEEFELPWPPSFHETLHKCVTTMAAIAQRQGKVNNMKTLGTEIIYARAMAL